MKPIYKTLILLALLSTAGCKKELPEAGDSGKKMELKMNVDKAAIQSQSVGLTSSPINQLTYVAYLQENGQEVARHTQTVDDPNFGSHTFELMPNKYRTAVIGSKAAFETFPAVFTLGARFSYTQDGPVSQYKTDDTFVGTKDFLVSGATTVSYQLSRVVGKIEFKVDSPAPYTVKVKNEAREYFLFNAQSYGTIDEPHILTIQDPAAHHEILILRTDQPLQLEFSTGEITRELAVDVRQNKRTIIQGSLNSLTSHVALNVVLNEEWSSEGTNIEF